MVVKGRGRAFASGESGAVAVEFALMLPLLVGLLLAASDLALAIHQRMVMQHILRVGAETAMLGGSESEVARALEDAADELATGRMSALSVADPVIDWRCGTRSVSRQSSCGRWQEPSAVFVFGAELPYDSILLGDGLGITLSVGLELEVPLTWGGGND